MNLLDNKIAFRVSLAFLSLVALLGIFVYGIAVGHFKLPPHALFEQALKEVEGAQHQVGDIAARLDVENVKLPLHYRRIKKNFPQPIYDRERAYPGVNLVTRVAKGSELAVDIVDMDGEIIHSWDVDWFRVWPDASHIADFFKPKAKPGSHIHGAVVMDNGDLVYNYEHLGLVKLNRDSEVVWRLPYRTHHSVHLHDDGMLWVSGQKASVDPNPNFPHREAPFDEYTILEIDPADGEIVNEWVIPDILHANGYGPLLHLVPTKPNLLIADDRLHLNDVETFPGDMEEGFFKRGDVIVSLRNVSTVFVFNKVSGRISYITTGMFAQQHDPDFIDGNRFSVFDNNDIKPVPGNPLFSRIVIVDARTSEVEVAFEGTRKQRFFTKIMGKHQWLPNGNVLITESVMGRAFEVDPEGEIVWQYVNKVGDGLVALVEEVSRYPEGLVDGWREGE